MAKQYVPTTPAGNVIGDGILFHLAEDEFVFVGRAPAANWLEFHGETGGYDVEIEKDDRSPMRPSGKQVTRKVWRFQIQGPNAWDVIEKINGGSLEQRQVFPDGRDEHRRADGAHSAPRDGRRARPRDLGALRNATTRCAKRSSRPARSSASSRWAPARTRPTRSSRAGSPRRSRRSTPARSCAHTASGSTPSSYEAVNAIAGSFVSDDIEDYYLNPFELGYGPFVKFDHDFHGREALEKVDPEVQRKKVTLAWNNDDMAEIFASMLRPRGRGLPVLRPAERELRLVELRLA